MSYNDSFTIRWDKTDFTKHGYIATYALGDCRCDTCTERWESWVSDEEIINTQKVAYKQMLKGKPRGKYRRRTTN